MICSKCNFQNDDTAKFCKNCGIELTNNNITNNRKAQRNGFGITGFVISIISGCAFGAFTDSSNEKAPPLVAVIMFAILGLIFSYIGFSKKNKKQWQSISGLAISGTILVVTIIGLCFNLFK